MTGCSLFVLRGQPESTKIKVLTAVVISEMPNLFFINKFRQAINESEMQHYVLLILTGIPAPGVNLTPVVMDPDNSVDLRKKDSRIVSLHGNHRDERQRRKRRFR